MALNFDQKAASRFYGTPSPPPDSDPTPNITTWCPSTRRLQPTCAERSLLLQTTTTPQTYPKPPPTTPCKHQNLVALNFNQEAREADLRYGLVRVRENAESIAFYGGESSEMKALMEVRHYAL